MPTSCLLNPRWGQKVFGVAARDYTWLDVFLAAMLRGDWRRFEQQLLAGLACLAEAERREAWPEASRIDEAATAFRYDRDLLTTDETTTWIELSGLTLDDWTNFLIRRLLRGEWRDQLDALVDRHAPAAVADRDFAAEGICSDVFDQWARTLAGRAAVCASASAPDGAADIPDRIVEVLANHRWWLDGCDAADLTRRLARVAALESKFAEHVTASQTPQALAVQLARNRLEWLRVDLERLSFDSADAAREAALCVREDGLTLSDLAIELRLEVRDTRDLLERLEPELRDAVLAAGVDHLIGPLAVGGRYEVAWVVGKRSPDLADPLVRARAEEAVIEQLVSKAILAHVRWIERPRT